jgi:hypothetical protein
MTNCVLRTSKGWSANARENPILNAANLSLFFLIDGGGVELDMIFWRLSEILFRALLLKFICGQE